MKIINGGTMTLSQGTPVENHWLRRITTLFFSLQSIQNECGKKIVRTQKSYSTLLNVTLKLTLCQIYFQLTFVLTNLESNITWRITCLSYVDYRFPSLFMRVTFFRIIKHANNKTENLKLYSRFSPVFWPANSLNRKFQTTKYIDRLNKQLLRLLGTYLYLRTRSVINLTWYIIS